MNSEEPGVQNQTEALLELTSAWSVERCKEITAESQGKVKEILHTAHQEARLRLHNHFMQDREHKQQSLSALEAAQQRHVREAQQKQQVELIADVIDGLHHELISRWDNAQLRHQWCETITQLARERLLGSSWTISYPRSWPSGEVQAYAKQVQEHTGVVPVMQASDEIKAGLLIESEGATLDCTQEGLLGGRYRLESEIIAALHALMNSDGENQ